MCQIQIQNDVGTLNFRWSGCQWHLLKYQGMFQQKRKYRPYISAFFNKLFHFCVTTARCPEREMGLKHFRKLSRGHDKLSHGHNILSRHVVSPISQPPRVTIYRDHDLPFRGHELYFWICFLLHVPSRTPSNGHI